MYLYVVKHDSECQKAINLVRKSKIAEVEIVDLLEKKITSFNLEADLGTSRIPILETNEYVLSGYERIESYLENHIRENLASHKAE